jgi:hypothetical protein
LKKHEFRSPNRNLLQNNFQEDPDIYRSVCEFEKEAAPSMGTSDATFSKMRHFVERILNMDEIIPAADRKQCQYLHSN